MKTEPNSTDKSNPNSEGVQSTTSGPISESSNTKSGEVTADNCSAIDTNIAEKPINAEESKLKKCENVIRSGIKSGLATGEALKTIRDEHLYKSKACKSFENYILKVWEMNRSHAYGLIRFAEVCANLSAMVDGKKAQLPANERQARELAKLIPEKQILAWKAASAKAGEKRVTVAIVRWAVNEVLGPKTKTELKPLPNIKGSEANEWITQRVSAITSDNYLMTFEQPLSWGDELADIKCVKEDRYLKFIDKVEVANALYAIALKAEFPDTFCIVRGEANKCAEVVQATDGDMTGLFCPHLNFFAKQAGVFVEFSGALYEPHGDDVETIVWKKSENECALRIFEAYSKQPIGPAANAKTTVIADQSEAEATSDVADASPKAA